ncbi:MAG: nuclear transport factor 2 family protein [Acidimicrobiales bacterium]
MSAREASTGNASADNASADNASASNASEEDGIRRTIAQYAHFCDDGRFAEFADLFAEQATFAALGPPQVGREAIRDYMAKAQPPERRGKHLCFNTVIEIAPDGASAEAVTDYLFVGVQPEGGYAAANPTSAGRYHDRLVRDPDRWRFAERRIVFMRTPS